MGRPVRVRTGQIMWGTRGPAAYLLISFLTSTYLLFHLRLLPLRLRVAHLIFLRTISNAMMSFLEAGSVGTGTLTRGTRRVATGGDCRTPRRVRGIRRAHG